MNIGWKCGHIGIMYLPAAAEERSWSLHAAARGRARSAIRHYSATIIASATLNKFCGRLINLSRVELTTFISLTKSLAWERTSGGCWKQSPRGRYLLDCRLAPICGTKR